MLRYFFRWRRLVSRIFTVIALFLATSLAFAYNYVSSPDLNTWSEGSVLKMRAESTNSTNPISNQQVRFAVAKTVGNFSSGGVMCLCLKRVDGSCAMQNSLQYYANEPILPMPILSLNYVGSRTYYAQKSSDNISCNSLDPTIKSGEITVAADVEPPMLSSFTAQQAGQGLTGTAQVTSADVGLSYIKLHVARSASSAGPYDCNTYLSITQSPQNWQIDPTNGNDVDASTGRTCANTFSGSGVQTFWVKIEAMNVAGKFAASDVPGNPISLSADFSPRVDSIDPLTGVVGQTVAVNVYGANLPSTIVMDIASQSPACVRTAAYPTQAAFSCGLSVAGLSTVTVKTNTSASGGTTIGSAHTFTVTPSAPTVTGVSPLTARQNVPQIFTVTGSNLTAGMGFSVADCSPADLEVGSGGSTQRQFQCTPQLAGTKAGVVKKTPTDTALYNFNVVTSVGAVRTPTLGSLFEQIVDPSNTFIPAAAVTGNSTVAGNQTLALTAQATVCSTCTPFYYWSASGGLFEGTPNTPNATWIPPVVNSTQTYEIKLTIGDNKGRIASAVLPVTVTSTSSTCTDLVTTPVLFEKAGWSETNYVSVEWQTISNAMSYVLQESLNAGFVGTTDYSSTGFSNASLILHNKTNGTYYYRVKARNPCGDSGWSNTSTRVVNINALPGAPTIGAATAGNTQATVNFVTPANTGGSPIINYTVTSTPGGFTAEGVSSPIVVTGLANGTSYSFAVSATNWVGTGAPSAASNTVTPISTTSALYVDLAGTGAGSVTSSPAGISCGNTCGAIFNNGSSVTLTATPTAGSTFAGWTGFASCASANACTFTMPAAPVDVTATFTSTLPTYAVTLSAAPVAGGTATGAGNFSAGAAVTATATANAGYTFSAWSGYAGCASTNPCNFTMPSSAVAMTATFTATTPLSGQVAYYCFDDAANLGKDCSTNANHGTPSGGVSAVSGVSGGAALFGGFSNPGVIHVPNSPTLQLGSTSTLSFFVKIDDPAGMDGYGHLVANGQFSAVAKDHDQHGMYWNFGVNAASQLVASFGGSSGVTTTPGTEVLTGWATNAIGRWVHVVHVVDSVGLKTYLDGQLAWSKSGSVDYSAANAKDMYIGRYSLQWYPLNGTLDELKLFNRALSATEVQTLYVNTMPSTFVLAVNKVGSGMGTVTSTPAGIDCGPAWTTCSAPIGIGTAVTLVASASAGSSFTGWSGACTGTGSCVVSMGAAKNVTATFVLNGPGVTLNPASLIFANQTAGTTSTGQNVTLTNTGNALLSIASIVRNNSVFNLTNNCGSTVAVGANCTFGVSFTPVSAVNTVSSAVVTSNAAGSPHTVILNGTGIPAAAPVCTLAANPAAVAVNGTSVLTSSCTNSPTSYSWTGGTCAGTTTATCTVTPAATTTYSVTGTNGAGSGTGSATVTVTGVDLIPIFMLLLN